MLFAAIAVLIGFAAPLGVFEGVLRFFPVHEPLGTQPVTPESPYMHFESNRDVIFSEGWHFAIVNRIHINNFGFVNDQDYDPAASTLLLAVVGDSYVEASMVPYQDTLQGRLAKVVGSRGRVYSFGASGAPLSQYLAYARFARGRFKPSALAVVVVGNDFDESLLEYKRDPGFHYLKRRADGSYGLHLIPWQPSFAHRVLRHSMLAQYLLSNVSIYTIFHRWRSQRETQFVGNTGARADSARVEKSRLAADYFLTVLPEEAGLPPNKIALVVDGMRPQLYDKRSLEEVSGSYFAYMREYLMSRARERGYQVVDLQPRFIERYATEGVRFEWAFNAHWNSHGHAVAAKAVEDTGMLERVFGPSLAAQ